MKAKVLANRACHILSIVVYVIQYTFCTTSTEIGSRVNRQQAYHLAVEISAVVVAEEPGLEQPAAFFVVAVAVVVAVLRALEHPFCTWDTTAAVETMNVNNAHGRCDRMVASFRTTFHRGKLCRQCLTGRVLLQLHWGSC